MNGFRNRGILLGSGMAALLSCATQREGDYRRAVSPAGAGGQAALPAPGLTRMTTSTDSENLFFVPTSDGTGGVFATNRHSMNLKLYRISFDRPGLLYAIEGAGTGNNIFPALSRDGTVLAFSSDRDGVWRIYLLDLKPHAVPRPVTPRDSDCLCPVWDPVGGAAGSRLAFCRQNPRSDTWDVCLLEVATGQIALLGPGLFPAWSPDGAYLAVQRPRQRGAGQYGLWLIRVDGSEPVRELVTDDSWAAANPSWSPDGKYLVFNTVGRGEGETLTSDGGGVYLLPLTGSALPSRLPGADRGSWRPTWGLNGMIYFHRREGDAVNIYATEGPELELRPGLAEDVR